MRKCKSCLVNKLCNTCKVRRWRKNNPIKSSFINLKFNAKRRGKEFDLTFDQFKSFAIKTSYIKNKGIKKDCYHIDRIDEDKGYTIDNIQVLTNSENVKKYHTKMNYYFDEYDREMKFNTLTKAL